MASFQSTTLIGIDTDLLVLLLYYAEEDGEDLYFRSDKNKEKKNVYDIKLLKRLISDDICSDLLFVHAFSGCDTTSRIFGVGKKSVFNKVTHVDSVLQASSRAFCTPNMDPELIEDEGCKMELLRYRLLSKKVCTAKTFVKLERLPPTTSAAKLHSRRTYLQVMLWMCKIDGINPTD